MLIVALLGPVEVHRDGVRVPVPSGLVTELLARLAVEPGRPVRADVLLEDLWSEPTSPNTLQVKVSQLRRALGPGVVGADARGYLLAVDDDAVDLVRAARTAEAVVAARTAGRPADVLEQARTGLALFRGEVLADAAAWATPWRTRFDELRLTLTEDALAARVELGAGSEVVAELAELVGRHPLREGLWSSLITALSRAGRQADALAAYERVRHQLADELGVDPGVALRTLHERVLRQELDVGPVPPVVRAGNVAARSVPDGFVGRDHDLRAVEAALEVGRLVTLVGPGGVGKTRLALEVAGRASAPGGVWLVRLDGLPPGGPVAASVAETLGVPADPASLRQRLTDALLVLDNCEHVLDGASELASAVLAAAPSARVLATSQAALGLPQEHRHVVSPLGEEDAADLFVRRAQQARPSIVVDDDARSLVDQVCQALDGLPLALELAAARTRSLSLSDLARRIDDRFALVRDPGSPRTARRRALAGTVAWSYDLLQADDRTGLWALACFAGTAPFAGVEAVLDGLGVSNDEAPDVLGRLVDRSLVEVEDVGAGELRYRLLDSVRSYASSQLRTAGADAVAESAYAHWYADQAATLGGLVRGSGQRAGVDFVRLERANVDRVLAWSAVHDPPLGVQLVLGLGWAWVVAGSGSAAAARVRSAVSGANEEDRVRGLLVSGWLEASGGDLGLAAADLDDARRILARLDEPGSARVLGADADRHGAFLAIQQGRPTDVVRLATAALAFARSEGQAWETAACLLLAAYGWLMQGETARAARAAGEALDLVGPLGDRWGTVHAQAMLGGIAEADHRYAEAAAALEQAADDSLALGFLGQTSLHRCSLGRVRQRAGDPRAPETYERAITEAVAGGDGRLAATARLHLARCCRSADPARAVALLAQNEAWFASAGGGDHALLNRCLLAACRDDGATLRGVLAEARSAGRTEVVVSALDALARLAVGAGDRGAGTQVLAEADALAPSVVHLLDDSDRFDAGRARVSLRRAAPPGP